ncbi:putative metacaspase type I, plant [Helianthus anomalus]
MFMFPHILHNICFLIGNAYVLLCDRSGQYALSKITSTGAMTFCFIEAIEHRNASTYGSLLRSMRNAIRSARGGGGSSGGGAVGDTEKLRREKEELESKKQKGYISTESLNKKDRLQAAAEVAKNARRRAEAALEDLNSQLLQTHMVGFQTFWIQMRKNKPLDENHKSG